LRSAEFTAREPIALDSGELVVKIWIGQRKAALSGHALSNPSSIPAQKTSS